MLVIVLEDEPIAAMLLEETLLDAGHDVLGPVETVADALVMAAQSRPDLALVDIRLRGAESGIVAAHEFKSRWNIPSLFVSGQLAEAETAADVAVGILAKPYAPDALLRSVDIVRDLCAGEEPVALPVGLKVFAKTGRAAGSAEPGPEESSSVSE